MYVRILLKRAFISGNIDNDFAQLYVAIQEIVDLSTSCVSLNGTLIFGEIARNTFKIRAQNNKNDLKYCKLPNFKT